MFDVDTINIINAENRKEQLEINERKNKILNLTNQQRKQEEWDKLFPKLNYNDNLIY